MDRCYFLSHTFDLELIATESHRFHAIEMSMYRRGSIPPSLHSVAGALYTLRERTMPAHNTLHTISLISVLGIRGFAAHLCASNRVHGIAGKVLNLSSDAYCEIDLRVFQRVFRGRTHLSATV